jgi:TonB family protein
MKNLVLILLICTSYLCKAQYISVDTPKYITVRKDTINIRGIVLDAFDNPVRDATIVSKNKEIRFYGLPIYTRSDKDGKFELDGALVTDTLEIWWLHKLRIVNNGSRYLEIHLPYIPNDTTKSAGSVKAVRKVKRREKPSFKVLTNANINDYFGVYGYMVVNAQFYGGPEKFAGYVTKNIVYPETAIENNIEGEVEIGFSIARDGSPTDFHVIRGIGYGCEEAVISAIKLAPKWRPGITNGRPNTSYSSVTINFKLTDN